MNSSNQCITVSSPGKALISGGYLVLEKENIGITIASSSRFYTTIITLSLADIEVEVENNEILLVIESPQFHSRCIYKYNSQLNTIELVQGSGNEFVEKCLSLVFSFCRQSMGYDVFQSAINISSAVGNCQIGLKLRADNDFYSQIKELQKQNLPLLSSSLETLPRFLPCPIDINSKVHVAKTGMGSSAALTTSLVGALLEWFGIVNLNNDILNVEHKRIVHNLSQLSHAIAQGKIGSGFDVSAAVYGSQIYTRFSAEGFTSCMENNASSETIYSSIMDKTLWNQTITPISLPPMMDLIMGDVCGGSSSTSMARAVLNWRASKTVEVDEIWQGLANTNLEINSILSLLCEQAKNNPIVYKRSIIWAANKKYDEWCMKKVLDPSNDNTVISTLIQASDLFKKSRKLLKQMGDCSNVGIEPMQQTLLADATEKVCGVLSAGVPGAGGVDAIFAIVLSPQARENVEIMWSTWGSNDLNNITADSSSISSIFRIEALAKTVVCPLLLKSGEAGSGVRIEKEISWE